MEAVKASDQKKYHDAAQDWEADRQARIEKSERRAWMVAGIAVFIAILSVGGIVAMAPFKRTVPYVFAVDRATGNVELVSAADDRAVIGYQELLDKHWTTSYVVARESYYYKLLQHDYDTVLALSDDNVGRGFAAEYDGANARDKRLGANVELDVKVLSVTISRDEIGSKAVVRYQKTLRRVDSGVTDPPQYYVATIAYTYKPSMFGKEKDLISNPMGFKVTSYRVDPEMSSVAPGTPSAK
jgi:type IV secretion system protein VirB8